MTPAHAGALYWQESKFYRAMARKHPERRTWYERLAREATEDRQAMEQKRTEATR